jgi:hypothetical protein
MGERGLTPMISVNAARDEAEFRGTEILGREEPRC